MRYCQMLYRKLKKFITLPVKDQALFVQAALLIASLRILLKIFPFYTVYSFIKIFFKKPRYSFKEHYIYTFRVIWAVELSGKHLLRTRCLAEALAVQILLNAKRITNSLQIGFIKNKDRYSAHAWIRAEDEVLIGGNQNLKFYFIIPYKETDYATYKC